MKIQLHFVALSRDHFVITQSCSILKYLSRDHFQYPVHSVEGQHDVRPARQRHQQSLLGSLHEHVLWLPLESVQFVTAQLPVQIALLLPKHVQPQVPHSVLVLPTSLLLHALEGPANIRLF